MGRESLRRTEHNGFMAPMRDCSGYDGHYGRRASQDRLTRIQGHAVEACRPPFGRQPPQTPIVALNPFVSRLLLRRARGLSELDAVWSPEAVAPIFRTGSKMP
jgi:hypothetical protein